MYKVLIVDDEKIIRDGLKCLLNWKELGYEIIDDAENGKEALDKIKLNQVDVLITDVKMPEMDGIELSQAVRALGFDIKIIILSAYHEFKYAKSSISFRASNYILKPINEEELIKTLVKLRKELNTERVSSYSTKRRQIIKTLLFEFSNDEIVDKAYKDGSDIDMEFERKSYCCSIIKPSIDVTFDMKELLPVIEEYLIKNSYGFVVEENNRLILLLMLPDSDNEDVINQCLQGVKIIVEKTLDMHFIMSLGKIVNDYRKISTSYNYANNIELVDNDSINGNIVSYKELLGLYSKIGNT